MPGTWTIRLARRLLHEDTFELMLAPAIADLQFRPDLAGRVAAWRSLAGALLHDLGGDVRMVLDDGPMLAWLVFIQASYYAAMLLLLVAGMNVRQIVQSLGNGITPQLAVAIIFVLGLSTIPTLLCFWPERRPTRAAE